MYIVAYVLYCVMHNAIIYIIPCLQSTLVCNEGPEPTEETLTEERPSLQEVTHDSLHSEEEAIVDLTEIDTDWSCKTGEEAVNSYVRLKRAEKSNCPSTSTCSPPKHVMSDASFHIAVDNLSLHRHELDDNGFAGLRRQTVGPH
ncbi:hypothetical protein SKAU_G00210390 [Synaphobranchus kaupii]|uniref:Uncharacterized protein n=1 Tax=Synaphobranchus kaupii TaxID=118154 RepID=A0A9Q1F8Z5_SYNKA|nr:hypothetical protein SKAU_G00210390 [Synaphobranchus kaupii]